MNIKELKNLISFHNVNKDNYRVIKNDINSCLDSFGNNPILEETECRVCKNGTINFLN